MILGQIASGNADGADICFLLGFIAALLAALASLASPPIRYFAVTVGMVALAAVAFGLLLA